MLTATVPVEVQPLAGFVIVSVYVPAALTEPDAALFGVTPALHEYVTPPVEELPLIVAEVLVQVSVCPLPIEMLGAVVLEVTATVPVEVHPPTGFVTVTV